MASIFLKMASDVISSVDILFAVQPVVCPLVRVQFPQEESNINLGAGQVRPDSDYDTGIHDLVNDLKQAEQEAEQTQQLIKNGHLTLKFEIKGSGALSSTCLPCKKFA